MAHFPESYADPVYDQADTANEAKLGIPVGLLASIRTAGEKSNASRVSSAGAVTPYQFIPATSRAILDKYGIDVTLSPENASEGAGLLLRDSLKRAGGDVETAVREYHGGTDRKNWGPVNNAYAGRVLGKHQAAKTDALESGFAKFMADNPAVPTVPLAPGMSEAGNIDMNTRPNVKNADGSISTVRSMGVNIDGKEVLIPTVSDDGRIMSDAESIANYQRSGKHLGKFSTPEASNAFAQNLHESEARRTGTDPLAAGFSEWLKAKSAPPPEPLSNQIPGTANFDGAMPTPQPQQAPVADPTLVQKILGGGEAALTLATGATTGALGMLDGGVSGLIGNLTGGKYGNPEGVEAGMAQGMANNTYVPRTDAGQEYADTIGKAAQNLPAVTGLGMEMSAAARGAGTVARGAVDASAAGVQRIRTAAPAIAERVQRTLSRNPDRATPTPGTRGSGGSAGTDMATQRAQLGNDIGIRQSLGQITRDPDQLRFELETAKGTNGAKIRELYSDQNEGVYKHFDDLVDRTDAANIEPTSVGKAVDKVLRTELARDKTEVRVKYKAADNSPEAQAPVTLDDTVQFLNESAPDQAVSPLLVSARAHALKLGIAVEGEDGALAAIPTTVKNAETFRRAVGMATDFEPTNIRNSALIKASVDATTEPLAGALYRTARRARENLGNKWENRGIISDLVNNKRGMNDRKVVIEDVFKNIILDSDRAEVGHMRRILHAAGDEGQQAWKDLQGATVNWIKEQAFSNTATDMRGNTILSVAKLNTAIERLEKGGKLDFIFGKAGAQHMRDVRELSKVIYTAPPGTVNTSNTASVLMAALAEAGVTGGMTGLPVPVLSGLRLISMQVKNRKIQQRIDQALNHQNSRLQAPPPAPPIDRTLH
jgi:hypothetical protein